MRYSRSFYTICGLSLALSEVWKQWTITYILHDGTYIWWNFPFQLCSIPMYVCLFLAFLDTKAASRLFSRLPLDIVVIRSYLLCYLMDFGLLGGIFAFLDTSGMHYPLQALTFHSFAWHILLIIIGCYSGLCKKTEHSFRGLRFSIILYLVCCMIATIFNLSFHHLGEINMFYINPHYLMHQVVIRYITDSCGNTVGLITYILATICGGCLFHFLWNRIFHRKFMDTV